MKPKKKRGVEAPPRVKAYIASLLSTPTDNIEVPLSRFSWEYEKGELYHWVDLFNHFEVFFEQHVKCRKDLQLENEFYEGDGPFPREAVFQVLRVTRIILENCVDKHLIGSKEGIWGWWQHVSLMFASTDPDIVIAALQTLAAFVKKPGQSNRAMRWHGDTTLYARLFSLSQGWGGKEEGLGLLACAQDNGCDANACKLGATLHFEFYAESDSFALHGQANTSGLRVIHIPDIHLRQEEDLQLLKQLVDQHQVPSNLRFSLLTRIRFARAFASLETRRQHIRTRLLAFTVLLQLNPDHEDLTAFFINEPEFVDELVTVVRYEDTVPEEIRLLAILALAAQSQDKPRQANVLNVISASSHRGILPSLMQKAIRSITEGPSGCSVAFVEGLLSLVTALVSTSSGCAALGEVELIPTVLPLLTDMAPQHTHLVTAAVHMLEAFMDYSNPAGTLFYDLGGLCKTIMRLKIEVTRVAEGAKFEREESKPSSKGKAEMIYTPLLYQMDHEHVYSQSSQVTGHAETRIPYHQRLFLKALLRAIALVTYAPGYSTRFYFSEAGILPYCLYTIFRHCKKFGGGVFSLAASVMSGLIRMDPTCFATLDTAGLPSAFLDTITAGVLPSSEAVRCIPHSLNALCSNISGLQTVRGRNAIGCFVKIFTSKVYVEALANDTPGSLASGLDELLRHAPSLRGPGVDMCIEILKTIAVIGSARSSATPVTLPRTSASPRQPQDPGADSDLETFLPDCINNAVRLLDAVLKNADTSHLFVEKKGIEALLQLYTLPHLPVSFGGSSAAHNMSVTFGALSPLHSDALTRSVCDALNEHLQATVDQLKLLSKTKLCDLDTGERKKFYRSLSAVECYLSLSSVLVRRSNPLKTNMTRDVARVLLNVVEVHSEVLWQIAQIDDAKVESKKKAECGSSNPASVGVGTATREGKGVAKPYRVERYANPLRIRDGPHSHLWLHGHGHGRGRGRGRGPGPGHGHGHVHGYGHGHSLHARHGSDRRNRRDFAASLHARHGSDRRNRRDLAANTEAVTQIAPLGRLARQADATQVDTEGVAGLSESPPAAEVAKRKSHESMNYDMMTRLTAAARGLYVALGEAMFTRRRDGTYAVTGADKRVARILAGLFHLQLLSVASEEPFLEKFSVSVLCQFLGKVVEDMLSVAFDNERRTCNTILLNILYGFGVIQTLLQRFASTFSLMIRLLPQSSGGSPMETENAKPKAGKSEEKEVTNSWLLDILLNYTRLMENLVTSSLLLTPAPMAQFLTRPVANAIVTLPKDPEAFVRSLQAQVLEVVLPVWNHPQFAHCNATFIASISSIVTIICTGVGDAKEIAQEDDELARASALSLGSDSPPKEESARDNQDKKSAVDHEVSQVPPVEDMLLTCMTLLQNAEAIAFHLTDLLVAMCNCNKGLNYTQVISYLIRQLKSCKVDGSVTDTCSLSTISHTLALVLSEDSTAREIAAENGAVSIALDVLEQFRPVKTSLKNESYKWLTALLLVLDHMLVSNLKTISDQLSGSAPAATASNSIGVSSGMPAAVEQLSEAFNKQKETAASPFFSVHRKSSGYMSEDEQRRAMSVAAGFLQMQLPSATVQAVLQLCARLTKSYPIASAFFDSGGLAALLRLPRSCLFPGFDTVAAAIVRHFLDDPQTLQQGMETEIRHTLISALSWHNGRVSPRMFLTAMVSVVSRDPAIFMQAASIVCQIETVDGRSTIVLAKEKEKDRDKDKEKEKEKEKGQGKIPEKARSVDLDMSTKVHESGKIAGGHHKKVVPHSFSLVIDQLLDVILRYPSATADLVYDKEEDVSLKDFSTAIDADDSKGKDKGKGKIEHLGKLKSEGDSDMSESSAALAEVTFLLRLITDIILMYPSAVSVVLERDLRSSEGRQGGVAVTGHGGLLYHILHRLLPYPGETVNDKVNEEEWREKLSDKAYYFVMAVCVRSEEGRKRVVVEIARALTTTLPTSSGLDSEGLRGFQSLSRKVRAFVGLVSSVLSSHSPTGGAQTLGFSQDMAKSMMDADMVQALTRTLQVIDLDHPESPKLVNSILKALEALTRADSMTDLTYGSDGDEGEGDGEEEEEDEEEDDGEEEEEDRGEDDGEEEEEDEGDEDADGMNSDGGREGRSQLVEAGRSHHQFFHHMDASDPFQGMNIMDEVIGPFRRPGGSERRRTATYRPFPDRPGAERGGAFHHPLLTRPSATPGGRVTTEIASNSLWNGTSSIVRDAEAVLETPIVEQFIEQLRLFVPSAEPVAVQFPSVAAESAEARVPVTARNIVKGGDPQFPTPVAQNTMGEQPGGVAADPPSEGGVGSEGRDVTGRLGSGSAKLNQISPDVDVQVQDERSEPVARDTEANSQNSAGTLVTVGESLWSLEVEIGRADGDDGGDRHPGPDGLVAGEFQPSSAAESLTSSSGSSEQGGDIDENMDSLLGSATHRITHNRNALGVGARAGAGTGTMDRDLGSAAGLVVGRGPDALSSNSKTKQIEGKPLVDTAALKALLRLLRLAQPLGKGLLQRLLLNLCAHSVTRLMLLQLLLDMLRPEADGILTGDISADGAQSQRLYGCQWNVVYARSHMSDGIPPLVSRRVLEILTYLARNSSSVANLLLYLEPLVQSASASIDTSPQKVKEKGKAKIVEISVDEKRSVTGESPLIILLELLKQPLYSRSSTHLEQVMELLEVVTSNAEAKADLKGKVRANESRSQIASTEAVAVQITPSDVTPPAPSKVEAEPVTSMVDSPEPYVHTEAFRPEALGNATDPSEEELGHSTSGSGRIFNASAILANLPVPKLRNLCKLLAQEGLSDTAYQLIAKVLEKLATVAPTHRRLFVAELAVATGHLSGPAVDELNRLGDTDTVAVSTTSMTGAPLLRVLQALSTLTSGIGSVSEQDEGGEEKEREYAWRDLNGGLEMLWQGLSVCIGKIEGRLGNFPAHGAPSTSASSSPAAVTGPGPGSVAPPFPPGTQKLLPFVKAFFVFCEKLKTGASHSGPNEPQRHPQKTESEKTMTFIEFADKHRRLLNAFVRQNPGLLENSLCLVLRTPRLIDFDNKRAYFLARIRQQHEQKHYFPLRIRVRRACLLEDSYCELQLRTPDELKGRLTVRFEGEEGIDDGGLTREWYQLLSRVICDKNALLFTTVGNEYTFQPNPNSVCQTDHLSYFNFAGRVVVKALFDGQLLDFYFTRSFYKHILGVKVTYHDIEAIDSYFKSLKWILENDISDIIELTFSMDADQEKHILYEKTEDTDIELIPGGRDIVVTEENKHEYVDKVAEHFLTTAIRPQIESFMEGFHDLVSRELISIFDDKELELLISGLPEIDLEDLEANYTEYTGYTASSPVVQWFWEVVRSFSKEDMARLLQFVTGTSKVPLEGFRALQGISDPQRFQIHKAYGASERLPSAHTCFNQLDLPDYATKDQLQNRLLLAGREASEGFGFR